ncbi:hypothetical protein JOD62_000664 [Microbacterium keratanolyticum]|uniref:Transcriptional regulator n=1 Tax=Microbacterium keratanolyticum TaxID=67574 RepID=A0A9W6HW37_9MICO|nr:DUF4188 domain-containing protein [Microbacterium keratanolyticum]MBM7468116.1 hypothetical protein [Microbacterium keratanolyticum]GLK03106.1 transcriptional regulator [Microbacterium keratanolyticum]
MAEQVFPGRYTASPDRSDITVFLIGMRANRWWKLGAVWRTARRMTPMLHHLDAHPEAGMLGARSWFGRTTLLLSYWESPEHLQRFAADRDAPHLAAWRDFARTAQGSGDVGVWHETYQVPVADLEAIYADMPAFGLAGATRHVPISAGNNTARQRLGR